MYRKQANLMRNSSKDMSVEEKARLKKRVADVAAKIKEVYPKGVMGTVAEHLESCEDMQVTSVRMNMPEYGLPDNLLNHTDVLIWWAHVAHDRIPDCLVEKIKDRVLKGMGFIPLHSAHPSKPMKALLGTSGSLKWREGDFCRVWNTNPTHPIAQGIPESFELEEEEMYGEFLIFQSRTMSYFELVSRWRSVPKRLYMAARLWKNLLFSAGT